MSEYKNVIPFPRLLEMLVEKGTEALRSRQYDEALASFNQCLAMKPNDAKANLGKVICYMELGHLEEAADICSFMLVEKIGDYVETVQIYVSILIQMENYEEAVDLLESIDQTQLHAENVSEFIHQWLQYCRQMLIEQETTTHSLSNEEIMTYIEMLQETSFDKQYVAIHKLVKAKSKVSLNAIKTYLKSEEKNPILKSILIQKMLEEKWNESLEIHKFSRKCRVQLNELYKPFEDGTVAKVMAILSDRIENENPTLYEFSRQLWSDVVMAIYPFSLPTYDIYVLAASIHYKSSELNGFSTSVESVAQLYYVPLEQLEDAINEITTVIMSLSQLKE